MRELAGTGPARPTFGSGETGRLRARRPVPAAIVAERLLEHWRRDEHARLVRLAEFWPSQALLVYELVLRLDARPYREEGHG